MTGPEEVPIVVLFEDIVGSPEESVPPEVVLLDEIVGSPDGLEIDDPTEELMLADIVGSPDGAELLGNAVDELFSEIVGNPEEAVEVWYDRFVTLGIVKGGIVPEKLLVSMVGMLDEAEILGDPVNEVLEERVGTPDGAEEALL